MKAGFMFIEFFSEDCAIRELMLKNMVDTAGRVTDDDIECACALHAGHLRLQTHSQYLILLVHSNSGYAIMPQCHIFYIQGVTGGTDQTSGGCSLC